MIRPSSQKFKQYWSIFIVIVLPLVSQCSINNIGHVERCPSYTYKGVTNQAFFGFFPSKLTCLVDLFGHCCAPFNRDLQECYYMCITFKVSLVLHTSIKVIGRIENRPQHTYTNVMEQACAWAILSFQVHMSLWTFCPLLLPLQQSVAETLAHVNCVYVLAGVTKKYYKHWAH